MTALPLPARLSGAIWGHLVGDALGVPYEFRTADQITDVVWGRSGTHHQPAGTWSDDGALMLALLVVSFVWLGYIGASPATPRLTLIAQILTFVYFAFFILMPWYTANDKEKPEPERVTG